MKLVSMLAVTAAITPVFGQVKKVGVFDSASIVVAYYSSPQWAEVLRAKSAERDEAKRANDMKKVRELESWGGERQEMAHRQLAGEAPIANIVQAIQPALAEVARKAGVPAIVSDLAWADPSVERVDVTDLLLDALSANERTRKTVSVLRRMRKDQSAAAPAGSVPQDYSRPMPEREEIQGYLCGRGRAWFYADGKLKACTIARSAAFGDTRAPIGSSIRLTPDGKPLELVLRHDQDVQGVPCAGAGEVPEPLSSDAGVYFHENGKLRACKLASDFGGRKRGEQFVQGP
jgi:hypothetical protein